MQINNTKVQCKYTIQIHNTSTPILMHNTRCNAALHPPTSSPKGHTMQKQNTNTPCKNTIQRHHANAQCKYTMQIHHTKTQY